MSAISKAVVFLALHGGPADHFGPYAETLKQEGYEVQIYAMGPALKKFQDRHIEVIDLLSLPHGDEGHDAIAREAAKACSKASLILTDVGHEFSLKLHDALEVYAPEVPRGVYYDNLEPFVPGGYSDAFSKVLDKVKLVFFSNPALAYEKVYSESGVEIDFTGKRRFCIGYYPVTPAETILARRKNEHAALRREFFSKNSIKDTGQKVLVYFGGNNTEYFSEAFPAFLSFLPGVSKDLIIMIQQHPGAKAENKDGKKLAAWLEEQRESLEIPQVILSSFPSSEDAQILADAALYYQTSMGPQFVIGGYPAIQIGHKVYEDILVKNGIAPTATSKDQLIDVVRRLDKQIQDNPQNAQLVKGLILKANWSQNLVDAIKATIGEKD